MKKQTDNNIKDNKNSWRKNRTQKEKYWRNEHGQPSYEFLQNIANEKSKASLEKLRAIAQDLDVSYSNGTTKKELVDKILSQIRSDPHVTT